MTRAPILLALVLAGAASSGAAASSEALSRAKTLTFDRDYAAAREAWQAVYDDGGGSVAALWRFDPKTQRYTLYPKPQESADTPKIQVTKDGAVRYSPRGSAVSTASPRAERP